MISSWAKSWLANTRSIATAKADMDRRVFAGPLLSLWVSLLFLVSGCAVAETPAKGLVWGQVFTGAGGIPSVLLKSGKILGTREQMRTGDEGRGKQVILVELNASHSAWSDKGTIVRSDDADTDLGDGTLYEDGASLYYIYRLNQFKGRYQNAPTYSIRIKVSPDQGATWQDHSVVEEIRPPKGRKSGLWTPSLLRTKAGALQAYYDDGDLPEDVMKKPNAGQWAAMKTWDESKKAWGNRVVVSRPPEGARGPKSITADGARTPIELDPGHIWSPVESNAIDAQGKRYIVMRATESFDGGKTWSWQKGEVPLLYGNPPIVGGQQRDWTWPLAAQSAGGAVMVVFRSNQEQLVGARGTSHQVDKNLYYLWRQRWSDAWQLGRVPFDQPTTDHGIAPTAKGGFIVAGRSKKDPREYVFVEVNSVR